MSRLLEWLLKVLLRKEVQTMAVVYATLIVKGKKTLEQVPAKLREEVEDILEEMDASTPDWMIEEMQEQGEWHPASHDFDEWLRQNIKASYIRATA